MAPSTGFPESRGGPGPGVSAAGSGGRPGGRDADRLGQVLGDLLENGARFARSRIDVSVEARAGSVSITMDDDDPGLAEGDRERVFDRLVRLDDARNRADGGSRGWAYRLRGAGGRWRGRWVAISSRRRGRWGRGSG